MVKASAGNKWYEGDHVAGGHSTLMRLGYLRDSFQYASAGTGGENEPQVLVLGSSYVAILTATGDALLEVSYREVRAVRFVSGTGVEVCVTRMGETGLREPRWVHKVSDVDGKYLEECWLDWRPLTHSGRQVNPLPWLEEDYAYLAGRVVTEAAGADVLLSTLADRARHMLGSTKKSVLGQSGSPLAEALCDVGQHSPAILNIAKRYKAWYEYRNFVSHGIRYPDNTGRPTSQLSKFNRTQVKAEGFEGIMEVEDQDFENLARLWGAFYDLGHDARRAYFGLLHCNDVQSALQNIPAPNTASPSEQFPPAD